MEPTGMWILLIGTVVAALLFSAINGFHDAANSIATVVSTRVLSPRTAVLWAAFFNFVAMFVFAHRVADTISKTIHIQQEIRFTSRSCWPGWWGPSRGTF